jgi:hypothetical protein
MNTDGPNLHEQQRKLEAIETRLARHEKTIRITMILVVILAVLALTLVTNHLWGFIP